MFGRVIVEGGRLVEDPPPPLPTQGFRSVKALQIGLENLLAKEVK